MARESQLFNNINAIDPPIPHSEMHHSPSEDIIPLRVIVRFKSAQREAPLDHEHLWRTMRHLFDRVGQALDHTTFLDDCLDATIDLLGADRGLIVLLEPDGQRLVVNARTQSRALTPLELQEVSKTIVEQVLTTGETVSWSGLTPTDSSASMVQLGILLALAGPLKSVGWANDNGPAIRGVVYIDFRTPDDYVGELQQEFFQAACGLLSTVVEQHRSLNQVRQDLQAVSSRKETHGLSLDALMRLPGLQGLASEVNACIVGDSSVLILGESGTGKTMLAQAIAEQSNRKPIVRATLGASDDLNTITSELFGHMRGSYSGATSKRAGVVEFAHRGTLILDEILNLPPHAQQLLLDFTQFGTYRPLGYEAPDPKRAEVRLIAATNGNLDHAMQQGKFREDLYYRLANAVLRIPPLRERRADIVPIAESVLRRIDNSRSWRLSVQVRRLLLSPMLDWPGNVRQLEGLIRRARERALAEDRATNVIKPEHIEPNMIGQNEVQVPPPSAVSDAQETLCSSFQVEPAQLGDSFTRLTREREALDQSETEIIKLALTKYHGVVAHAARELDMPRTSLLSRMATLGIEKPKRPTPP